VQKLLARYEKLPPGERLVEHFRQFAPTNPLAQAAPHSIYSFSEAGPKGKADPPTGMAFGTPNSGVAFLSLPTAIWALSQPKK
jgi:hypothetical protein